MIKTIRYVVIFRYKDILDKAIESSKIKPKKCIIFQRKNVEIATLNDEIDISWDDALRLTGPHPCVSVEANEPLYILYTSGTTGNSILNLLKIANYDTF